MNLKKIAKLTNFSVSTVSKALRNCNDVSEETAKFINKVARENGYFKDKYKTKFDNLKKEKNEIVLFCSDINDSFKNEIISKINNKYFGHVKMFLTLGDDAFENTILENLSKEGNTKAIISFPSKRFIYNPGIVIPIILIERNSGHYSSIYTDIDSGFREILKMLKNNGHNDIGFIGLKNSDYIFNTLESSMNREKIQLHNEFVQRIADNNEKGVAKAVKKMLHNLPTAIICQNENIAIGVIKELMENNIRIPEDVSVISANRTKNGNGCCIDLTALDTNADKYVAAISKFLSETESERSIYNTRYEQKIKAKLHLGKTHGQAKK